MAIYVISPGTTVSQYKCRYVVLFSKSCIREIIFVENGKFKQDFGEKRGSCTEHIQSMKKRCWHTSGIGRLIFFFRTLPLNCKNFTFPSKVSSSAIWRSGYLMLKSMFIVYYNFDISSFFRQLNLKKNLRNS